MRVTTARYIYFMNSLESSTWSKQKVNEQLLNNAREMRKVPTKSEGILWDELRNRKLFGAKFRRQHPFQGFILDFYCEQAKLCIEVDGNVHDDKLQIESDNVRQEFLLEFGIKTIRFRNEQVENDLPGVLKKIRDELILINQIKSPHPD